MLDILKKVICTGCVTENIAKQEIPKRFRGQIKIEQKNCTLCDNCRNICPVEAIKVDQQQLKVDDNRCIYCGYCTEVCETKAIQHSDNYKLANIEDMGRHLNSKIHQLFGRSMHVRHLDVGSCNACDFELAALSNPVYDLSQYGVSFVASPRHADAVLVTGVITSNLKQALLMTYAAVPSPKLVIAVGACAAGGKVYEKNYATVGAVNELIPVDVYIPGCPPRPDAIIYGLLLALNKL